MRLHDARHWYATQLVAAGTDLNTVADQLGHSTPAFTLAVYGHSDAARATCRSRRRRGSPVGLTAR
jgi:integrase